MTYFFIISPSNDVLGAVNHRDIYFAADFAYASSYVKDYINSLCYEEPLWKFASSGILWLVSNKHKQRDYFYHKLPVMKLCKGRFRGLDKIVGVSTINNISMTHHLKSLLNNINVGNGVMYWDK